MKLPLALSFVVVLAASAGAQIKAPVVTSFGGVSAGWGASSIVTGVQNGQSILPLSLQGLVPQIKIGGDTALKALAPLLVQLESSGMTPEQFLSLDPTAQAQMLESSAESAKRLALSYSNGLVEGSLLKSYAEKPAQEGLARSQELESFARVYSAYLSPKDLEKVQTRAGKLKEQAMGRLPGKAEQVAKSLAEGTRKTSEEAAEEPIAPKGTLAYEGELPKVSEKVDSRLLQIRALGEALRSVSNADEEEALVSKVRKAAGGPGVSEAAQRAAIRVLVDASEKSEAPARVLDAVVDIVAVAAPPNNMRYALENIFDNQARAKLKADFLAESAIIIALNTSDRSVKETAVALLLRELKSAKPKDAVLYSQAIDKIRASVKGDLVVAPAAPAAMSRPASADVAIGLLSSVLVSFGLALAAVEAVPWPLRIFGGIFFLFGLAVLFLVLKNMVTTPWFRKE